jgi:hypothetical protein
MGWLEGCSPCRSHVKEFREDVVRVRLSAAGGRLVSPRHGSRRAGRDTPASRCCSSHSSCASPERVASEFPAGVAQLWLAVNQSVHRSISTRTHAQTYLRVVRFGHRCRSGRGQVRAPFAPCTIHQCIRRSTAPAILNIEPFGRQFDADSRKPAEPNPCHQHPEGHTTSRTNRGWHGTSRSHARVT